MSKKMKLTPTFQCPLFNVKVTEEDSVQLGSERVWVWGFLAFLTKYRAWNQEGDIPQSLVEEARCKSMTIAAAPIPGTVGMYKVLKACFGLQPHPTFATLEATPGTLTKLNKHEFWLKTLEDSLCPLLLQHLLLDSIEPLADISLLEILETVYMGLLYTFSWNPILACAIIKLYNATLEKELSGDDFWTYNPVKLVQATLWCKDMRNELQVHVERFHPTRHIPLGMTVLTGAIPMCGLRQVSETTVSDQDRAIAVSTGLTQTPTTLASVLASSFLTSSVLEELGASYVYSTHSNWGSFHPSPDEDEN